MPPARPPACSTCCTASADEDLAQPETYQVLINYLGSERVSLRELAYWHLERLVPGGAKIGYEPLAPKEKRDAAHQGVAQAGPRRPATGEDPG